MGCGLQGWVARLVLGMILAAPAWCSALVMPKGSVYNTMTFTVDNPFLGNHTGVQDRGLIGDWKITFVSSSQANNRGIGVYQGGRLLKELRQENDSCDLRYARQDPGKRAGNAFVWTLVFYPETKDSKTLDGCQYRIRVSDHLAALNKDYADQFVTLDVTKPTNKWHTFKDDRRLTWKTNFSAKTFYNLYPELPGFPNRIGNAASRLGVADPPAAMQARQDAITRYLCGNFMALGNLDLAAPVF